MVSLQWRGSHSLLCGEKKGGKEGEEGEDREEEDCKKEGGVSEQEIYICLLAGAEHWMLTVLLCVGNICIYRDIGV